MPAKAKKKPSHVVKIIWNRVPSPANRPMKILRNGEKIADGVNHEFRPEGAPTKRIWCEGCHEYFKRWGDVLWRHGMRKKKPPKR